MRRRSSSKGSVDSTPLVVDVMPRSGNGEAVNKCALDVLDDLLHRYYQEPVVRRSRDERVEEEDEKTEEEENVRYVMSPTRRQQQDQQCIFQGDEDNDGDEDEEFKIHHVTPHDTLGGLELRYGVSATVIRRLNGMTSDRLTSHLALKIPKVSNQQENVLMTYPVKEIVDPKIERLQVIRIFQARFPDISDQEVDYYMKLANGCVKTAINVCNEDHEWEKKNQTLLRFKRISDTQRKKGVKSWLSGFWRSFSSYDEKKSSFNSTTTTTTTTTSSSTVIRSQDKNFKLQQKTAFSSHSLSSPNVSVPSSPCSEKSSEYHYMQMLELSPADVGQDENTFSLLENDYLA